MRVGFIGTGRIGLMHVRNLAAHATEAGVSGIVLFDDVAGRAEQAARQAGPVEACVAASVDALLDTVDAVVVAVPTPQHPALVEQCVEAGVPTLCEKPLASDLPTMVEIVQMVEGSSATVVVGFQRRFDPALRTIKASIAGGQLGEVYVVRSNAYDATSASPEFIRSSGGIYRDLMIHDLDAVPWLVGQPVTEVLSWGSVLTDPAYAEADDVDFATVSLKFAGGALAVMVAGRHNPVGYDHRIEVLGSRDSVAQGWSARTPVRSVEPEGTPQQRFFSGFADRFHSAYVAEVVEFLAIARGRVPNPSPARDSLVSIQLADACDVSRRSGRPVTIQPLSI